jgi:RHH-type proline utilization regulon transcriptional repressor/proline dehydrogenase/delta 1-pyrroline-5-carboxylate dehydrogenase
MPDDFSANDLTIINRRTRELGGVLLDRLKGTQPSFLQRRWWDDRLMAFAMRDERLKVELFRFVDVLPMLGNNQAVVDHLSEYLGRVPDRLPRGTRTALDLAETNPVARTALARMTRLAVTDFARRFIAGVQADQVLRAARRQRRHKRGFTLDILGEAVTSEREAERYFQAYVRLIESIAPEVNAWPEVSLVDRGVAGPLPRVNVSVKLSALDSQFDAVDPAGTIARVGPRLRQLLRVAREHQAFINIDMESYAKKELTIRIFREILAEDEFRDVGDVGIVIQCYLTDAADDLLALRSWARERGKPIWVRLVKGAYWDYETAHAAAVGWPVPVYQQKWQSDVSFERQARFVLSNHEWLRPAVGSHNIRSIAYSLAVAEHVGLPDHAVEIQMLYGMADAELAALVADSRRVRVYMPYGELIPGMAYLVRRLLENTSNDSFVRPGFVEQATADELLADPEAVGQEKVGRASCLPDGQDARRPETDQQDASPTDNDGQDAYPTEADSTEMGPERARVTARSAPSRFAATFANQPPVDFARAENRRAMTDALSQVREMLGRHYPLHIGGQVRDVTDRLDSIDPSETSQTVGTVALADADLAADAVAAARAALPDWAAADVDTRADLLRRIADGIRQRFFEFASWQVYECGKPWREATNDVCEAIDFCEYYADRAVELLATQGADVPGEENRFEYLPRGVAAVIAPWNFPLAILTGMTTAALVAGNTVVVKPAGQSSVIAAKLMELIADLDAPPGVVNYLPGRGSVAGTALVEHPEVALIAFTGSREVGLGINTRAAEVSAGGASLVKRVIAEMGGKNAMVVDEDADLDEAVLGIVQSAFGYQGQKCSACSRVVAHRAVHDALLERLVEAARSLQVGPAEDPGTTVGPLIDAGALGKVREYIEIGRQEGREVLSVDVGGLADRGFFVGPHIFADVPPDARLAQEEIFGPVLAVIRAADFDEAIRIANSTQYALTAGIFSRSPARLDRARTELVAGNIYLNRSITGALVGRQPFGGFRLSGIGSKAGGSDYLPQFLVPKTITENTMRRGFAPPLEE